MRGKLQYNLYHGRHKRITPAGAGKTRCWAASRVSLRDHPRGCGENLHFLLSAAVAQGSPPRMRGKRQKEIARAVHGGITPADAGKTVRNQPLYLCM